MDVIRHTDVHGFADRAMPLFEADPVRHTIALTLMTGLREAAPDDVLMITVEQGGHTIGCAFRSPPWASMLVSALPVETHQAVVDFLLRERIPLGGVSGPRDVADSLMPLWTRTTGQAPDFTMGLRLHRLVEFVPPVVPGHIRHAVEDDIPLLGAWWDAFSREEHGPVGSDGVQEVSKAFANGGRRFGIWTDEHGEPVSMAGGSPPLHGMSRIGPVFTPKEHRGRGYGSGVTAAMTRWALDQGAEEILLFTDVANPVSNAIYHRIGYRPVMEAVEHRLPDANTLDV